MLRKLFSLKFFMKLASSLAVLSIVLVSIVVICQGMSMEMPEDSAMSMSSCLFPMQEGAALCPMGALEMISQWQKVLLAIPVADFFLLFALCVIAVMYLKKIQYHFDDPDPNTFHLKNYQHTYQRWRLYNYFLVAFSRGILHSRVYA